MNINNFWKWFSDNETTLWNVKTNEEDILSEMQKKLVIINKNLSFEISDITENIRELIISANGDENLFSFIEEFVLNAPKLSRWKIIALKPPRGFNFTIDTEIGVINPSDLYFDPLKSKESPDKLGLKIFIPQTLKTENIEDFLWLIIETGLGEKKAKEIKHLEWDLLPKDYKKYISIKDLENYIDWFKNKTK